MRDEADREAERLRDLGRVLVRADPVGRDVLEHGARVRARLQRRGRRRRRPTCASTTTLAGSIASASGAEREERRGRVAAGVRDQPALGGQSSGSAYSTRRARRPRMVEAVPLRVERRVGEPVRAGEVDDDAASAGGSSAAASLVAEAEEDDVGAAPRAPRRSSRTAGSDAVRAAGRARTRAWPASESEPSATSSSSGCASTRSSVSWPV